MDALIATLFSDPMMGLAYECEPTLDRLARRFGQRLELRYAMVVLVQSEEQAALVSPLVDYERLACLIDAFGQHA